MNRELLTSTGRKGKILSTVLLLLASLLAAGVIGYGLIRSGVVNVGANSSPPTVWRTRQPLDLSKFNSDKYEPKTVIAHAFPPISDGAFQVKSKDTITQEDIRDHELVLGVRVGKQARAYPINILTGPEREIINDTLGNRAIAATW